MQNDVSTVDRDSDVAAHNLDNVDGYYHENVDMHGHKPHSLSQRLIAAPLLIFPVQIAHLETTWNPHLEHPLRIIFPRDLSHVPDTILAIRGEWVL